MDGTCACEHVHVKVAMCSSSLILSYFPHFRLGEAKHRELMEITARKYDKLYYKRFHLQMENIHVHTQSTQV